MKSWTKKLVKLVIAFGAVYCLLCVVLYCYQEKFIFLPTKLPAHHEYIVPVPFEEYTITADDGIQTNAVLIRSELSRGVIYYLHGNAGNIDSWLQIAEFYNRIGYDLFLIDYRGFGKSQGQIESLAQLHKDNLNAYDFLKTLYHEDQITVIGYSIGSGLAAYVAAHRSPERLILQAPYYSLTEQMTENFSWVPSFLLRYPIDTHHYLNQLNSSIPVSIFHGLNDRVIPVRHTQMLAKDHPLVDVHYLKQQTHNGINYHPEFREYLLQMHTH